MAKYQIHKNQNLFDAQDTIQSLSDMGNPLETVKEYVDFEAFRNILKKRHSPQEQEKQCGKTTHRSCSNVQDHRSSTLLWSRRRTDRVSNQGQDQLPGFSWDRVRRSNLIADLRTINKDLNLQKESTDDRTNVSQAESPTAFSLG